MFRAAYFLGGQQTPAQACKMVGDLIGSEPFCDVWEPHHLIQAGKIDKRAGVLLKTTALASLGRFGGRVGYTGYMFVYSYITVKEA